MKTAARRLLLLVSFGVAGCTLLARFDDREDPSLVIPTCPSGGKACQSDTVIECVAVGNPSYGCLRTLCTPCAAPNVKTYGCVEAGCTIEECFPGFEDCDGDPRTGCETKTDGDPKACGSCTNDCFAAAPQKNYLCANGQCFETACAAPLSNCEGTACETDTSTSLQHCGHCGNVCQPPNAAEFVCQDGECRVVTCAANFANCDGLSVNGCEINLRSDDSHCGECDEACRPAERCFGGECVPL